MHKKTKSNPLLELAITIALPALILSKASGQDRLGPFWALIVALSLPLGYGIWEYIQRRKFNFIALLGLVSIMLTGGLSMLKLDPFWMAVKEAGIPGLIGLIVLGSCLTRKPLARLFFFNPEVVDVERLTKSLEANNNMVAFEKKLVQSTVLLSMSFFVSSILNYVFARIFLQSAPGSEAYNQELAKMNLYSMPGIMIPSLLMMVLIIWFLFGSIRKLTGEDWKVFFRT